MASKVARRTITRFHTVVSVEALRTNFVASIAHPAGITYALAIVLPALGLVLAVTLLIAVHSVESIRANFFAIGTGPSWRTLTRSGFMRALSSVLAGASVTTLVSIRSRWTRMFAGSSNITRSAGILSCNVIASCIGNRAPFLASMAKESIRTRFVTRRAGPTSRADAITGDRITGRVVVAGAYFVTRFSVVT